MVPFVAPTYMSHTHYIYIVMLKCINVQIYKKNGDNPNTYSSAMAAKYIKTSIPCSGVEIVQE